MFAPWPFGRERGAAPARQRSRAMDNHGAFAPYPMTGIIKTGEHVLSGKWTSGGVSEARRKRESICWLANWLPAARAAIASSTTLSIRCGEAITGFAVPPTGYRGAGQASRACASMYWLANWLPASRTAIASSAVPSIGYRPPQERVQGKHVLCEHVPTGKLIFSGASRNDRIRRSINRVRKRKYGV